MVWPDYIWHIAQKDRHYLELCANRSAISGAPAVFERHFLALRPFSRALSEPMPIFRCDFRRNDLFHDAIWRNVQARASFCTVLVQN
jgi:hypothetical protein